MKNMNITRYAIFMATATKMSKTMLSKLAIAPSDKRDILDYIQSELGQRVAGNESFIDTFMQSEALLYRTINNIRIDYFREKANRVRREIPLYAEMADKTDAYSVILFNLYLSQILTPDEERYARFRLSDRTDKEYMEEMRESRRTVQALKKRVRAKFLQVFRE